MTGLIDSCNGQSAKVHFIRQEKEYSVMFFIVVFDDPKDMRALMLSPILDSGMILAFLLVLELGVDLLGL